MRKFFTSFGRFATKLVSLLVICGFISLACLPMVHAAQGADSTEAINSVDFGDCQPTVVAYAEDGNTTDEGTEKDPDVGSESTPGDDTDNTGDDKPATYTITIQYCNADGKKIASDKVIGDHPANQPYHLVPVDIPGYEAIDGEQITAEINKDTLFTIRYEKIITKATLTIHYEYANKTEAAADYTEEIEIGKPYEVESPIIDGYTPNEAVVSGAMVEGGVEVTVTYTQDTPPDQPIIEYTITIKYQDTAGETIAEDTTEKCEAGKPCTIVPKDIDGYITPGSHTEEFTEDTTITFAYEKTAVKATLTIHYEYDDKTKAADDWIEDIEVGKAYEIESPRIANYTPDRPSVKGTMTEDGVDTTVTYTKNSPDKPVEYTITIYYEDAAGKELAPATTAVRTAGEHTFEAKEVAGYIKPASQTINVSSDTSITFTYEKDPVSNPEEPGDEPGPDDSEKPTAPDDSKYPTDSDQKPDDQKPNDQKPGNQAPSSLPTAGVSDELIRDFLILDAEVSAGGVSLWAISGVIRKIRRR